MTSSNLVRRKIERLPMLVYFLDFSDAPGNSEGRLADLKHLLALQRSYRIRNLKQSVSMSREVCKQASTFGDVKDEYYKF